MKSRFSVPIGGVSQQRVRVTVWSRHAILIKNSKALKAGISGGEVLLFDRTKVINLRVL